VQAENEARQPRRPWGCSLGCRSAVSSPRSDGQLVVTRGYDHGKRGPASSLTVEAGFRRVAAHHRIVVVRREHHHVAVHASMPGPSCWCPDHMLREAHAIPARQLAAGVRASTRCWILVRAQTLERELVLSS